MLRTNRIVRLDIDEGWWSGKNERQWRAVLCNNTSQRNKRPLREVVTKRSGDFGNWWGSQSTKPCVFLCKVAAGGDERYLVCAAGAAGVIWFLLCVLQRVVVPACVILCVSWSCGCRSHWNGCMNVACSALWGGSRSTKPCVIPCKVAAGGDESYLVCAAGAAGVVWFLLCVLQRVVVLFA